MDRNGIQLDWLDDLKQRADILTVIGGYVPLTRKGGQYWACCPFHAERTPSFCVDYNKGTWFCYGACHEGGDVISFEMKINDIGFGEAVRRLAARVGMKVPENFGSGHTDGKQKEKMFEMMIEAARYYRSCLNASPQALAYLRGRGLTDRTIATFGLGYCPDSYGLIKHLTEKGFDRKMMFDCSLLGERDGEYYDFQTGRAIVPIFDAYGKVIGFGGRVLVKKEGVAKYKNSRDTLLFDKKRVLYGLNYVKKSKIGNPIKDIILVEGYMDVIGLYQAGVKNAVASMGTMLTDLQAKALKAMVDIVYICYDGDFAGQTSTLRGLDILKKHDLDVRVMTLPDGKDPDEMVRDHGLEGFMQCKKQALPLYEYLLHRAKQEQDMTSAAGKSAYVKRALEIIGELDPIEREVYVNEISKESGVSRSRLLSSLPASQKSAEKAAWQEEAQSTALETPQSAQEKPKYKNAERFVLSYLLENPLDENRFFEENLLRDETRQRMHAYIMKCVAAGRTPDVSSVYLLEQCDKTEIDAVMSYKPTVNDPERFFKDCLKTLEDRDKEERKAAIIAELETCESEERKRELTLELMAIQRKRK